MARTTSTAAIVTCLGSRFEDVNGLEDPDTICMAIAIKCNGVTPEMTDAVYFSRSALSATKQAAVRLRVNQLIASYEPGVNLTNANIQISGLPV